MMEASEWTRKIYAAEHALFRAEQALLGSLVPMVNISWLSIVDCDISTFLRLCPDVVVGKYLAVTSIDGTTPQLTDQEKSKGWSTPEEAKVFRSTPWSSPEYRDDWKVAYSPRVVSIYGLPNETHVSDHGFHECHVFVQPVATGAMEAFVNWIGFRLYDPKYRWAADRFWEQIARQSPESHIAEGTVFTFATRNNALLASVLAAFSTNAGGASWCMRHCDKI